MGYLMVLIRLTSDSQLLASKLKLKKPKLLLLLLKVSAQEWVTPGLTSNQDHGVLNHLHLLLMSKLLLLNSSKVLKVTTKLTNGTIRLLLRLVKKLPVLLKLPLKLNTPLCSIVVLSKDGSLPLLRPLMLLPQIMEVNQSLLLLPTKRLLMMLLKTLLFSRSLVNSLRLWLFHTQELLMLMVDTSEPHLLLFQLLLLLLLLLRLTPLPIRP